MKPTFTLLELLLVAGMVAILAAVAMPNYVDAKLRAQTADAQVSLNAVTSSLLRYRVDTNAYPPVNSTDPLGPLNRLERLEYLTFTPVDKFKSIYPDEYHYTNYFDYRSFNLGYLSSGTTPAGVQIHVTGPEALCLSSVGPDGLRSSIVCSGSLRTLPATDCAARGISTRSSGIHRDSFHRHRRSSDAASLRARCFFMPGSGAKFLE